MRDLFPYGKRYNYPHMKPNDIAIWERFISAYPDAFENVQYDFHVGDPPPFNPLMDDGTDTNQDLLYKLKIDVIGHAPGRVDIIEIKPSAGPSAIGQIKAYRTLYVRDETPTDTVGMIIITDKENPNMDFLTKNEGVQLIVV